MKLIKNDLSFLLTGAAAVAEGLKRYAADHPDIITDSTQASAANVRNTLAILYAEQIGLPAPRRRRSRAAKAAEAPPV